ncbi:MAG: M3 family oligoendopeptidase [Pseudomonadota bacterium]
MGAKVARDVVWCLDDLYLGPKDPNLQADERWCKEEAERFSDTYLGKVGKLSPQALFGAIQRFEKLQERSGKLLSFAYLFFSTQTQSAEASSLWQEFQEFNSILHRDTLFFELEWSQLDDDQAQEFMESPEVARYRHYLLTLRKFKPHLLNEREERLLAEKQPIGTPAWCTLFDKVMSHLRFGVSQRSEAEVLSDLYHPDRKVRKKAALEFTTGLESVLHIVTHIFNTILLDKSITDRLRNYPHWLRARNLLNEADDEMVEGLVRAVFFRYDLVKRYYRLKQKLLGYDTLFDYDRYAPLPELPAQTFTWEEAKELVLAAYSNFSSKMAGIVKFFFDEGWIHAAVIPGKISGAFSHPTVPRVHPFILLNYTGTHRDVMTLAHELGHGIHQYLARKQGFLNSETPLITAEMASVFGEMLVFQYLLKQITDPGTRIALLCTKLEDVFATIFRQVSMNRFEDGVHKERREKGELASERLSQIWMNTQKEMFGGAVELLDHYRIWWAYIPHFFHSPGYIYAYAFGELLVLALYQQYKEKEADFVPLYVELLEAGGKKSPKELLQPFGINLADPQFWHQGLTVLEDLLQEAEKEAGLE